MKKSFISVILIFNFLYFTSFNFTFGQESSSLKSNIVSFNFYTANKQIDFNKVWDFKNNGIYDGDIIKTNYVSSPSFDQSNFIEDYNMFSGKNHVIYQDCSDIHAYNKITKKYYQIWTVNVHALRNCPYSTEFISENSILVNFHNQKVNVEINLTNLKYRIVVN